MQPSGIRKIDQNDVRFRVFLNNGASVRLKKDAFIERTCEDCLRILNSAVE